MFQVERSQEVLKTIFLVTTKEKSRAALKKTFLGRFPRLFGNFLFCIRWNRPIFFGRFKRKSSKQLHTIQNEGDHVSEKIKSCFSKYSISQDISNAGCREPKYQTERSKTSAAKTWFWIWTRNRYCFKWRDLRKFSKQLFSYNQSNKPTRPQKTFLESTQRRFGNFVFCFRWNRPIFFGRFVRKHQNNCTQYKTTETRFLKKTKAVFLSIQYYKTSQTQDVKSQITKRSVRKLAQPKLDSAFEQEARIVSSGEIWRSSENSFFSYNQRIKPTRAQKYFFGTCSLSFWKVSVLLKKQKLFL